jgi:endo-1,3(4)-beta-glucanase
MQLRTHGLMLTLALAGLAGCSSGSSSTPETGCPSGFLDCGGACFDPKLDAAHCGSCGNACLPGLSCVGGACTLACSTGQVACGGACIDPQTDETWCGASGDCAGALAGATCAAGQSCLGGRCTLVCPAGRVACGGACIDPLTDETWCGASGDCAGALAGTTCAAGQACQGGLCTGSCTSVPLDLATPFATDLPTWIISKPGQQAPTALWASTAPPLPTNTSWQNLVLGAGGNRVDFLPYQVRAEPVWLDVANATPANFVNSATEVRVPDMKQLMLGANEFGASTTRAVIGYDLLSVTLRYGVAAGTMTAPLVQGMPYVTVDYAGLQPVILPGSDGVASRTITSVNGSSVTGNLAAGSRFQLALSDGTTWIVYASSPVTFNYLPGKVSVNSAFTGTLRVANAPTPADVAVLDAHAGAIPRGGTVEASVACDVASLRFNFATTGTGALLMAAMPHHLARLAAPVSTTLAFQTLRGKLTAVVGSSWGMSLPLPAISWTAPRAMAAAHVEAVRTALAGDAGFIPDAATVDLDPYFGGKLLSKLARLALIADELGEAATAATLRARLAPLVAAWLDGTNGNPLVYDTTWGGVVTTRALANPSVDFGQGHYNDHHFHYGYHLYAAAALARADPTFATTHRSGLLALVRDIANPSPADPKFPRFRPLDFFRGHSWAAGLTEFADGQNQESTSEAVNAWYGLQLLGAATGDARMRDLGRVLLALEVDSARTYWQIPAATTTLASTVYQDPFAQNRCVGILFETRAFFGTFFGAEAYKVYGIQLLPYTPVSEALVSPAWVADAWPKMQAATVGASQGWQGLLYMAHATVDPAAAWSEVTPLTAWDDGNSKTNTLWWVASRP